MSTIAGVAEQQYGRHDGLDVLKIVGQAVDEFSRHPSMKRPAEVREIVNVAVGSSAEAVAKFVRRSDLQGEAAFESSARDSIDCGDETDGSSGMSNRVHKPAADEDERLMQGRVAPRLKLLVEDEPKYVIVAVEHLEPYPLKMLLAALRSAHCPPLIIPKGSSLKPLAVNEFIEVIFPKERYEIILDDASRKDDREQQRRMAAVQDDIKTKMLISDPEILDRLVDAVSSLAEEQQPPIKHVKVWDEGGYFSVCGRDFGDKLFGRGLELRVILEQTENGFQKHLGAEEGAVAPVAKIAVARSRLKEKEDQATGKGIVLTAEYNFMKYFGVELSVLAVRPKHAVVIGHGKIGRGIAVALKAMHVYVVVFEPNPTRATSAKNLLGSAGQVHTMRVLSQAGEVPEEVKRALGNAFAIFSATGKKALHCEHLQYIPDKCIVATATSADDELDDSFLGNLSLGPRQPFTVGSHSPSCRLLLLHGGAAANLAEGYSLGATLIQLWCLKLMLMKNAHLQSLRSNAHRCITGRMADSSEFASIEAEVETEFEQGTGVAVSTDDLLEQFIACHQR
eukprot:CAMPEP_0115189022 /NCGR_PEP_ID=MMETSP0270-20121206/11307_1 /TAXON_ID=71861 /ORGANISM="Scrippsiella trochoidea, Strain CCMP3099" /LENGTH=564 /DNA_ID=CAMNT_0002602213 /DNA_START=86 /DNA_END=1780 /DNA_ORIENTATION=+